MGRISTALRSIPNGLALSAMDGATALCRYVLYHELGHCLDDLERGDLETYSSPSTGTFDQELSTTNHAHVCLSEYAACRKAAAFMSCQAWQKAVEEFRKLLPLVRDTVATDTDVANVATGVWKIIVEYTKPPATFHGHQPTGRACGVIGDSKVTAACGKFDDYLTALWDRYPSWVLAFFSLKGNEGQRPELTR
jgi:hypothetical protein